MVRSVAKADKDGLGVADVEVAIGLWRESREHLAAGESQVLFAELWSYLRVLAWFVELPKESFLEDTLSR